MDEKVKTLRLEERYLRYRARAHRYLVLKQSFDETKLQELGRLDIFSENKGLFQLAACIPALQQGGEALGPGEGLTGRE